MTYKTSIFRTFAALLIALLSLPALAADPMADVDVSIGAGAISWNASGSAGKLTVNGPEGFRTEIPFGEGEAPSFVPALFKEKLADGSYRWEIAVDGGRSSGAFSLQGGSLASPALIEGGMEKAEQVLNDLIVEGSICAGLDCKLTESFSFDTIRLKENNLRLAFVDTSNQGSFPRNDWALVANDTENGGADHFSIEDATAGTEPFTVAAGLADGSLYIDAAGVGFGTATPAKDLHVVSDNTPTLRLEQDGSDGFTPQTWDVAASEQDFSVRDITAGSKSPFRIKPGSSNDALVINGSKVGVGTADPAMSLHVQTSEPTLRLDADGSQVWDVAGDAAGLRFSDSTAGTVPFQIKAGTPQDTMVVAATGRVGVGTSNPNEALHLKGDDGDNMVRVRFEHDNGGVWSTGIHPASFAITRPNSGGNEFEIRNNGDIVFRKGGFELARLNRNGNLTTAGTVNGTSDVNKKRDFAVTDTATILERVESLPITSWSYKADEPGIRHLGPMAQDFYAAFGLGVDERHIAASDLAGVALAAIQQLSEQNAALTARLAALEAQVSGAQID